MGTSPAIVLAVAASVLAFVYLKVKTQQERLYRSLPPGPPADPLIGHIRLIPQEGQDIFFHELGKNYGDVVQLKIMGKSMIILNSAEAAVDLLEKRSANYSDRPTFPVIELLGIADTLVFAKYGENFRLQRRMIQQYFTNAKRPEHRLIQTHQARVLAQNLLLAPEDWDKSLLRHVSALGCSYTTSIVIQIGYGHQIVSNDDPYLEIAEECCRIIKDLGTPGATPIDLFPILRYFPSWFPGTHYATFARDSYRAYQRLREYPYLQMVKKISQGIARPSFLLSQLEALDQNQKGSEAAATVDRIQAASAILFVAGSDTVSPQPSDNINFGLDTTGGTASSLAFFVSAMVLYPECQAKAQEEIEAVVGPNRLPEFHDRENLPYLECLVQETLRAMEDDVYRGMLIPKGSTVMVNIRIHSRSTQHGIYQRPTAEENRSALYTLGLVEADDSLWIAIATMLATVQFSKALDKSGNEITPDATPVISGVTNFRVSHVLAAIDIVASEESEPPITLPKIVSTPPVTANQIRSPSPVPPAPPPSLPRPTLTSRTLPPTLRTSSSIPPTRNGGCAPKVERARCTTSRDIARARPAAPRAGSQFRAVDLFHTGKPPARSATLHVKQKPEPGVLQEVRGNGVLVGRGEARVG
ncbi:hypothetical protein C0995_016286 [Termitomyces sp. Mi166|nr:hypothetical protein C0995_016286 [Termitomyces sp. Mi166\